MLKEKKGNFEQKSLCANVRTDCMWWVDHVADGAKELRRQVPKFSITSDSSDFAWGGMWDDVSTGGAWNLQECTWHINVKETLVVFLTLCVLCASEAKVHIRVKVDNMMAVVYIN